MLIGGKASKVQMFARMNNFGEQVLAIALHVETKRDADAVLVLPLPVKPGGRCAFADVQYDEMFVDIGKCWEPSLVISDNPRLEAELLGNILAGAAPASNGVYFASRAELARLDVKLRPPAAAVAKYADYGFAVFRMPKGQANVMPLALVFESREPNKVYFPLLAVGADGKVPERVRMDHAIYLQTWTGKRVEAFVESDTACFEHVDVKAARGLVRGELRAWKTELRGERKNEDFWARLG
jgi:hypothetical protein